MTINRLSLVLLSAFTLVAAAAPMAANAQIIFDNGGGDNLWSNPANWDPGGPPDGNTTGNVHTENVIVNTTDAKAKDVNLTIDTGLTRTFDILDGAVIEANWFKTGTDPGTAITNNHGSVVIGHLDGSGDGNAGGWLIAHDGPSPTGIVNNYGTVTGRNLGTQVATSPTAVAGTLNMFDGLIHSGDVNVGVNGVINFDDGVLRLAEGRSKDAQGVDTIWPSVQEWVDALTLTGQLVDLQGGGLQVVEHGPVLEIDPVGDAREGRIYFDVFAVAIPEPATVSLVGLGAVMLFAGSRRRIRR